MREEGKNDEHLRIRLCQPMFHYIALLFYFALENNNEKFMELCCIQVPGFEKELIIKEKKGYQQIAFVDITWKLWDIFSVIFIKKKKKTNL